MPLTSAFHFAVARAERLLQGYGFLHMMVGRAFPPVGCVSRARRPTYDEAQGLGKYVAHRAATTCFLRMLDYFGLSPSSTVEPVNH